MKKKLLIALSVALVMCVGAAWAQTEVLSQNAVGYIKVTVDSQLTMISVPFDDVGYGPIMFTNLIGPQVTGTPAAVYIWTGSNWDERAWTTRDGWKAASNLVMEPGESYFLKRPSSWSTSRDLTLSGQVPDVDETPRSIRGAANLNTLSFSYPVSIPFTNTFLYGVTGTPASLYIWTGSGWSEKAWTTRDGWKAATNVNLEPGKGYFFKTGSGYPSTNWNETKPYTWP